MTIINLDDIAASGGSDFLLYAAGLTPEIPAGAYAGWGPSVEPENRVRRRLSIPIPPIGVFRFEKAATNRFGLVADAGRTFVSRAQFGPGFGKTADSPGFDQPPVGKPVPFDRATVLYRPGDHIYGHWLVDILPRAWLIRTLVPDLEMSYVIRKGTPDFARNMLTAIGIAPSQIVEIDIPRNHPVVSELYVAGNMRFNQVTHPAIRRFSQALTESLAPEGAKFQDAALFVSRQQWKARVADKRLLINAPEIEHLYEEAGYRAIAPETYTFADQIAMFRKATALAGNEGSGLHNSIFAPPGIAIDALVGPNNKSLIQVSLAFACDQTVNLISGEGTGNGDTTRDANFVIPPGILPKR